MSRDGRGHWFAAVPAVTSEMGVLSMSGAGERGPLTFPPDHQECGIRPTTWVLSLDKTNIHILTQMVLLTARPILASFQFSLTLLFSSQLEESGTFHQVIIVKIRDNK